jgi:hypothetical protein
MQFINPLLSLLISSTLVSSVPITKRDTTKVLLDLTTITNNTILLSSDLVSFLNNSTSIKPFHRHFADLRRHIEDTTTDITAAGSYNSSDSQTIASQAGDFTQAALNLLIALMNNVTLCSFPIYESEC